MNNIFLLGKERAVWRKTLAGFMALSLNLSLGGAAALIPVNVAYAADTGYMSPTADVSNGMNDHWTTPGNAYGDGNLNASNNEGDRHRYSTFGFTVPSGATINGIEVLADAWSSDVPSAQNVLSDGFGTGDTDSDVANWNESGSGTESRNASGGGNDSASSNGGRFAAIEGAGWICRTVDATGMNDLTLEYKWRGDSDAENEDRGIVEYKTSGSCADASGWSGLQNHDLSNDNNWSSQSSFDLSDTLDNTTFLLRFRSSSSNSNEYFRVDGVLIEGRPATTECKLGVDLSWNGGTSWVNEKSVFLPTSEQTLTLGGVADLWTGHSWLPTDFSDSNFQLRIHDIDPGSSCDNDARSRVDWLRVKVSYTDLDTDSDGVIDSIDNCDATPNPGQENNDADGAGDACDTDDDNDGDLDDADNCQFTANSGQEDHDADGTGTACDQTPYTPNEAEYCEDGIDNDNDEDVDLADSDCQGTLTVTKTVYGGPHAGLPGNFTLKVCPTTAPEEISLFGVKTAYAVSIDPCVVVTSGATNYFTPGWYLVTEDAVADYELDYTQGDCNIDGKVYVGQGEADECGMSNTYIPPPTCDYGGEYPNCNPPPEESCDAQLSSIERTSNTSDVHVGSASGPLAVAVGYIHGAWTASIPGATWVWSESPITNPANDPIDSFFDVFQVVGTPTGGSLTIAGDNTFEVYMNGTLIGQDVTGGTFGSPITISTGATVVTGENTLEVRVKNLGVGETQSNPAGLLYKLTVNKNACVADVCPNLDGAQSTLPDGYEMVGEQCIEIVVCNPEENLLKNGGFETPVTSGWGIVPFGGVLEWLGAFVNPLNTDNFGLEIQNNVAGSPFEGSNLAELDGYHPTKIWQNVVTKPGYDYSLTFKYSPRPGYGADNNVLEVRKDGVALGAQLSRGNTSGDTEWSTETREFVANAASASIEFADVSATDDSLGTYLDDVKLSCVGVHVPKAMVEATKIICDSESNLPDWSGTGKVIDAYTAQEFVDASDGACHIDPTWKFQWAPTTMSNPGDNTGEAPEWNTFVSTAFITLGDMTSVWVREVWDDAYVHFTGTTDTDTVSAEMYCNGDAYHYDNLDYANGLTDGGTVYCVAFNAPVEESEPTPNVHIVKYVDGNDANDEEQNIDSFFDVFIELSNSEEESNSSHESTLEGENNFRDSFFDIFTELSVREVVANGENESNTMPVNSESCSAGKYRLVGYSYGSSLEGAEENDIHHGASINIEGSQEGSLYVIVWNESCETEEIVDACPNDEGFQENAEQCTPTPVPPGGGGSSTFSYWGCTNPAATNYNSLANVDDGSCQMPGGPTGGGEGGQGGGSQPEGEVLGAATVEPELALPPACVANPYLHDYLKMGKKNDPEQVKLLQTFLNENMAAGIPVTGHFGQLTKNWVKKFQKLHHAEIIQPWIDAGYDGKDIKEGTGVVYKTTKRFINILKCDALLEPMPNLTGDQGL